MATHFGNEGLRLPFSKESIGDEAQPLGRLSGSLALSFFVAQPKPVQKPSRRGSVDFDATFGKFEIQFAQSQFAMSRHPLADPIAMN